MESRLLEDHLRAENNKLRAEVQAWRERWKQLRETLPEHVADKLSDTFFPITLKRRVDKFLDDLEQQHPVGAPKILSPAGIGSSEQVASPGSR